MKQCRLFGSALVFLLVMFAQAASADVVVYADGPQHKLYLSGGVTLQVRYSDELSVTAAPDGWQSGKQAKHDQVIVVERLATYWIKPAYGAGKIRVTVPMTFYLTSWDVRALERELERLGVKVKPKPSIKPAPKPGPVISG